MKNATYEDCINFHGHVCGGVTIGYVMSVYAMKKINAQPGEMLYCKMEMLGCMTDAVQVMTGCTIGKKNLVIEPADTRSMYLVHKSTGEGVKVNTHVKMPEGMTRREMPAYILSLDPEEICSYEPVKLNLE